MAAAEGRRTVRKGESGEKFDQALALPLQSPTAELRAHTPMAELGAVEWVQAVIAHRRLELQGGKSGADLEYGGPHILRGPLSAGYIYMQSFVEEGGASGDSGQVVELLLE
jgi:hypothetical protein